MNTTSILSFLHATPRRRSSSGLLTWLALLLFLANAQMVYAKSATWLLNPPGHNWNTKAAWDPITIPNGKTQVATFDLSNRANIFVTIPITLGSAVFNAGASAYTISIIPERAFAFAGLGVVNNSSATQTFLNSGQILFSRSSAAGTLTSYVAMGGSTDGATGGLISFQDLGSAANGAFVAAAATVLNAGGGEIDFSDNANGSNATFAANGASLAGGNAGLIKFTSGSVCGRATFDIQGGTVTDAAGATLSFTDSARANQATITNQGATAPGALGGVTEFLSGAAGGSTLIANGGSNGGGGGVIRFEGSAKGGRSRVEIFGNGGLDVSASFSPGVTIGSLEGDGDVTLGARGLTVGANAVNTTFSGLIHDEGSLTKTGESVLTLDSNNTYSGGTFINGGTLLAVNRSGSSTGTGPVTVQGGVLGGRGFIGGPVYVGAGDGSGGSLYASKGTNITTTLTITDLLTFNSDGDFTYKVKSGDNPTADQIVANGVLIGSGATFTFQATGNATIAVGRVIIAMSNTSADPIAGTFANLADNSIFTANNITYEVSYEGGDGNDLTLTVIP